MSLTEKCMSTILYRNGNQYSNRNQYSDGHQYSNHNQYSDGNQYSNRNHYSNGNQYNNSVCVKLLVFTVWLLQFTMTGSQCLSCKANSDDICY